MSESEMDDRATSLRNRTRIVKLAQQHDLERPAEYVSDCRPGLAPWDADAAYLRMFHSGHMRENNPSRLKPCGDELKRMIKKARGEQRASLTIPEKAAAGIANELHDMFFKPDSAISEAQKLRELLRHDLQDMGSRLSNELPQDLLLELPSPDVPRKAPLTSGSMAGIAQAFGQIRECVARDALS